jgi:hypothetical protein
LSERGGQLLWFGALWLLGVVGTAAAAYLIHWAMAA